MPITKEITHLTPVAELIEYSKKEIEKLNADEEFLVKDLFLGYEWKRIGIENRTHLGASFFNFAQGNGASQVAILDKTPQNQQRYRKK